MDKITPKPILSISPTKKGPNDELSSGQKKTSLAYKGAFKKLRMENRTIDFLPAECTQGISRAFVLLNKEEDILTTESLIKPLALTRKRGLPTVSEENIRCGIPYEEAGFRERIASIISEEASERGYDLQVPKTELVSIPKKSFPYTYGLPSKKVLCSSQTFIPEMRTLSQYPENQQSALLEDPSPSIQSQIRKIAFLDIQLANTDRKPRNILVNPSEPITHIVPIDHALSLSHRLKDRVHFTWLNSPAVISPINEEEQHYINGLSSDKMRVKIRQEIPHIHEETLETLDTTINFLKKGCDLNMSPYEMGCLMHKDRFEEVSPLEAFTIKAKEKKPTTPLSESLSPYLEICLNALREPRSETPSSFTIKDDPRTPPLVEIARASQMLANPTTNGIRALSEREKELYEKFKDQH